MLQASHIVMNIGVSLSIKKAFIAQVKKNRNKNLKRSATINQESQNKLSKDVNALSKVGTRSSYVKIGTLGLEEEDEDFNKPLNLNEQE